ncbi:MAG TPA: GDYXXLXY domain-containing protein [Fimbriimonas sp.]
MLSAFVAAVAFQAAIVAYIPLQASRIRTTGEEVLLPLMPNDPYDLLAGYSMTLRYEASDLDRFRQTGFRRGDELFVRLRKAPDGLYDAVSASPAMPILESDEVVLKGRVDRFRNAEFGIETFYFPEDVREEINDEAVRALGSPTDTEAERTRARKQAYAEVRVDDRGRASLTGIFLNGKAYRY